MNYLECLPTAGCESIARYARIGRTVFHLKNNFTFIHNWYIHSQENCRKQIVCTTEYLVYVNVQVTISNLSSICTKYTL